MATYNLYEELKNRENEKKKGTGAEESKEKALDDVTRVKVLSPGRKVFKRFIRNRLAVFGTVTLAVLFIFSFIGPVFYSYGQKEIFYTFEEQYVNYALAKENTTYTGYNLEGADGYELEDVAVNSMNSNIKSMVANDETILAVVGETNGYVIEKIADNIYTFSVGNLKKVATLGNSSYVVGTYDSIGKSITYTADEVDGLDKAAASGISGNSGSFELGGVEYTYEKAIGKSYTIMAAADGLNIIDSSVGTSFKSAAEKAAETGVSFEADGKTYSLVGSNGNYDIYEVGDYTPVMVYTRYTMDTYETGLSVSDEFKAAALMGVAGYGSFEADGIEYSIAESGESYVITAADGSEFAELSTFVVRRYTGEDTLDYDLKKALAEKVEEMNESDAKTGVLTYNIPAQDEDGSVLYDADGNVMYSETDMDISQQDTGEYVIKCNQVNYIIDRYASPSLSHPLGTDGDGFDVMARIMYGGRVSLMVGFVVVILETVLGVIMGGLAGFYGGWVDNLIMRLVDIFYCLPSMPIMIILGAMMDAMRMDTYTRLMIMMGALGIMGWAGVARLVRGQILSLREQEFMVAAEATGIKVRKRIFKHLIPNVMPQLIVTATMGIGSVILTESTLSFLGLGVKHPLATWGTIINSVSSASAMAHYAFIWIPVGLLICLTVIAFNFVGDGLRDAYDPKSKK